jgi:hypothetical protein
MTSAAVLDRGLQSDWHPQTSAHRIRPIASRCEFHQSSSPRKKRVEARTGDHLGIRAAPCSREVSAGISARDFAALPSSQVAGGKRSHTHWRLAQGGLDAASEGVTHFGNEVGKFFKDPFGVKKWADEKLEQTRAWLEGALKQGLGWFLAGLLGIVLFAVLISSFITGLFIRKSLAAATLASEPRALRKRASLPLTRFLMTFCIGVGATLAWQSHGDAARKIVARSYPQLGWLAPRAAVVQQLHR